MGPRKLITGINGYPLNENLRIQIIYPYPFPLPKLKLYPIRIRNYPYPNPQKFRFKSGSRSGFRQILSDPFAPLPMMLKLKEELDGNSMCAVFLCLRVN